MKYLFDKRKEIGLLLISVLMIVGGLQILLGGFLENPSASNSVYEFNGIERLMGFLPIFIGGFFSYAIILNLKNENKK